MDAGAERGGVPQASPAPAAGQAPDGRPQAGGSPQSYRQATDKVRWGGSIAGMMGCSMGALARAGAPLPPGTRRVWRR